LIFKKTKYTTPAGSVPRLYADMLEQPHILIAGATGSGKSIVINGLIYTALYNAPCNTQFILIDPKRVELVEYARLPHTLAYASEPQDMAAALNYAVELMDSRYKEMHKLHEKETHRGHMRIVIDEFADLMTTQKAETVKPICRLAQLGRAAHINLMIATQRPTRDIITGQI